MVEDKKWSEKRAPQKVASVLDFVVRFASPILIFVFILMSGLLRRWLTGPIADAIAALLVVLPSYWLIPNRKLGFPAYAVFCTILAGGLAFIEHLLIP
jgi:hypothetical protein